MKKSYFLLIVFILILSGCSKKIKTVKLKEGTPAYQLAKELSMKWAPIDPDENQVLASTTRFQISSGDVVEFIWLTFGSRSHELTNFDAEQMHTYFMEVAEQLAEQRLLLEAADRAEIFVDPSEVDSLLDEEYRRLGGEEKVKQLLEENNLSKERMRQDIKEVAILSKYINQFREMNEMRLKVTEDEINEKYREDKTATVRHILLVTKEKSDSEKEAIYRKMEKIMAEAKSGADFSELARQHSEDPGSKENGGLYEDFGRGQMVKPFDEAAFSVPVGEVSDIVETVHGYHILKVINRKQEARPIEEVRSELFTQIFNKKWGEILHEYIQELKSKGQFKKSEI